MQQGEEDSLIFLENYSNVVLTVNLIPVNAMAHLFYHLLSMAGILAAHNHFLQDTEETYFVITGKENIWIFIGFGETVFICSKMQEWIFLILLLPFSVIKV